MGFQISYRMGDSAWSDSCFLQRILFKILSCLAVKACDLIDLR